MEQIKKNVKSLMERLDYPETAQSVFLEALDKIAADKMAVVWLNRLMTEYSENENCNYIRMLADFRALGNALGIHEQTSGMLLFLCLGERLRERFAERGIDESIYYNSLADLRYKLEECRLLYGRVGTFVASWNAGFFRMTRFGLGRLQFEITKIKDSFTVGGIDFPAQTSAIAIHIPRTGTKLDHGEVLASYRRAVEMFGDQFEGKPILITCSTWMFDPWHETVLSPTSNMMTFARDFKMIASGSYDTYEQVWRLFDKFYEGDPDALPADSSLRRAYIDRIKRGEPTGWARGVFIWRDGEIIND